MTSSLIGIAERSLPSAADAAAAAAGFHRFAVEAWTLLAVGVLVTVFRTYVRITTVGVRKLTWDDFLVWAGVILYVVETALAYSVGNVAKGLANSTMTAEERAALAHDDIEFRLRVTGCKIQLAGWATYGTMLWFFKSAMLVFYVRLTSGLHKSYTNRIYFGFALLASTYITLMLTLFLTCRPFHKYWQINPDPGNSCQPALSMPVIWTNLALNASTDFYLISIPVPLLWKSGLKLSKKIASTILFTAGFFIVICSLLRSITITLDPTNGPQLAGAWGIRESFVATVVTSLPIIFPRLKHWFKLHLGPLLSLRSSNKSYDTPTGFRTIGGGDGNPNGGVAARQRRNPVQSVNHIPTKLTFTESEERLVEREIELRSMQKPASSTSAQGSSSEAPL